MKIIQDGSERRGRCGHGRGRHRAEETSQRRTMVRPTVDRVPTKRWRMSSELSIMSTRRTLNSIEWSQRTSNKAESYGVNQEQYHSMPPSGDREQCTERQAEWHSGNSRNGMIPGCVAWTLTTQCMEAGG